MRRRISFWIRGRGWEMSVPISKPVATRVARTRWGRLVVVMTTACVLVGASPSPRAQATRPGEEASRVVRATFRARAAGPAGYSCTVLIDDPSSRILDFFEDGSFRTVGAVEYGWRVTATADLFGTHLDAEEPELLDASGTRRMARESTVATGTHIDLAIAVWRGDLANCEAYDSVGPVPLVELDPGRARVFHYSHFQSPSYAAVVEHDRFAAGWVSDGAMATGHQGRRVGMVMDGPDVTWTDPAGNPGGNGGARTMIYDRMDGLWHYRLTTFGVAFNNPYSPLWVIELP